MASVTDKKNITLKEKDFPQLDHSKKTKPRTLSSQVSVSCLIYSPRSSLKVFPDCPTLKISIKSFKNFCSDIFDEPESESKVNRGSPGHLGQNSPNIHVP